MWWYYVRDKKKRPASAVDPSPGRRFKRCRAHHSDTPDYIQLTGGPNLTDPWEIQLTGSLRTRRTRPVVQNSAHWEHHT